MHGLNLQLNGPEVVNNKQQQHQFDAIANIKRLNQVERNATQGYIDQ
jgi:hypothetical protein